MRTEEEVKDELKRLKIEMDRNNTLAMKAGNIIKSNSYSDKAQDAAIRYWAIRWVMGWEQISAEREG